MSIVINAGGIKRTSSMVSLQTDAHRQKALIRIILVRASFKIRYKGRKRSKASTCLRLERHEQNLSS